MAVLSYNEILPKTIINYDGTLYLVLSSHIFRMQQRKPVNQTKLRNLVTGKVIEISFHQNESVPEADVERMQASYLYSDRKSAWFSEIDNPKNRFSFPLEAVTDQIKWLAPNSAVEALMYDEKPVSLSIPVKVELEVKEAPPSIKGNTSSGGNKPVTLSTGAVVNAPLFINVGDVVRVNTNTGEYTERVEKA